MESQKSVWTPPSKNKIVPDNIVKIWPVFFLRSHKWNELWIFYLRFEPILFYIKICNIYIRKKFFHVFMLFCDLYEILLQNFIWDFFRLLLVYLIFILTFMYGHFFEKVCVILLVIKKFQFNCRILIKFFCIEKVSWLFFFPEKQN